MAGIGVALYSEMVMDAPVLISGLLIWLAPRLYFSFRLARLLNPLRISLRIASIRNRSQRVSSPTMLEHGCFRVIESGFVW
jgi:hypothetical protein